MDDLVLCGEDLLSSCGEGISAHPHLGVATVAWLCGDVDGVALLAHYSHLNVDLSNHCILHPP